MANTKIPSELVAINAISGTLIADNAITSVHIAENNITAVQIAINAVTALQMADGTITSAKIADGTIVTADIADGQITTGKLADSSVTTGKIAAGTIASSDIANNAILTQHIDDNQITADQIADNAVGVDQLAGITRGSVLTGNAAGNPSLLALGAANTLLQSDGTDLVFAPLQSGIDDNSNAVAITIDSSENVGIGTTAPSEKLVVNVDSVGIKSGLILNNEHGYGSGVGVAATALQFGRDDSPDGGQTIISGQIYSGNENETTSNPCMMAFSTKSGTSPYTLTEHMRISSTGNVGIGTTNPDSKLHIKSTADVKLTLETDEDSDCWINFSGATSEASIGYEPSTNTLRFANAVDGVTSNVRMAIDTSGSVGIGTTTPQRKFTVVGAAGSASDNSGIIQLNVGTGANTDAKMTFGIMSSHAGYIHVVKPGNDVKPLILNPTGSASGKVGIGHTTPVARLHLKGTGSYNHTPANPQGADFLITSSEMGDNNYHSIMQLVSVRQSLSTGSGANGYLGFSTIDDSNNVGINDAARIAVYNEGGTSNTSPTALSFWTNSGSGGSTGAATERMRITSVGDIMIGNTTVQPSSNHSNQAGFGYDVSTSQLQIASTTNNAPMELSRNSANDGNWMTFRKQGNIYGNIGTLGGTLYIGSAAGGIMFNGTDIEPTTGGATRANDTVSIGSSTYKFKDLYLSGSTNILGNIDLAGSINAVGVVTANHIIRSDAGHNTARIEAVYDDQSDVATKGNMLMWVSEPGITYDAGGIGTNVHSSGHYYGRKYDNGYSVFQRFEKQTANIVFYNNQGTAGTAGATQTEMLRIYQDGNLRLAANAGIGFGNAGAAHTLDDYEEGTWTPAIVGATSASGQQYSSRAGSYVKIGRSVTANFSMVLSAKGNMAGSLKIIGLPFNGISGRAQAATLLYGSMDLDDNQQLVGYQYAVNPLIYLFYQENDTALVQLNGVGAINNNTEIQGSVTYFTDS
jgi:hypothetical protein